MAKILVTRTDGGSMFSDEDFSSCKQKYLKYNQDLANDVEKMDQEIEEIRSRIVKTLALAGVNYEIIVKNNLSPLNLLLRIRNKPECIIVEEEKVLVEEFVLIEALPNLQKEMIIPEQKVKIMLIDDSPREIVGIQTILNAWYGLECTEVILLNYDMPVVPLDVDILLLDEVMLIRGMELAKRLREKGFKGLIASISSGGKPSYTEWHFSRKNMITFKYQYAKSFVDFINSILKILNFEEK